MKRSCVFHLSFWSFILFWTIAGQLTAAPAFKWGLQERLRNTFMNNNVDFNKDKDDKQDFYRFRTTAWGQYDFSSKLSVRVQINNEFRHYTDTRVSDTGRENTGDEIIFEHLFLKYTTAGQNPVTVTLGRQNLMYGEGFILLEGNPWDGSRTIFHDAAKISYKKGDVTYDFLGISNSRYDYRLPKLSFTEKDKKYLGLPKNADGDQLLNDGLEEAIGLYVTKKPATGTQFEGYYFFKVEHPDYVLPAFSDITTAQKTRLNLHTIGGRMVHPLATNLKLLTEWAYQIGGQADNKISAYGGYANIAYTLCPKKSGTLTAGFNLLSGDDPKTADVEGWDPLFSRWPKWSELYIYSQTAENNGGGRKIAYWSNTFAPNLKFDMVLNSKVDITLWAHHLQAFYSIASGNGLTRGDELQLWVRFKFTKMLTGHFLADYFMPGDFYADPRTNAVFIRGELMYTLQ
jgi:hypothetical protein